MAGQRHEHLQAGQAGEWQQCDWRRWQPRVFNLFSLLHRALPTSWGLQDSWEESRAAAAKLAASDALISWSELVSMALNSFCSSCCCCAGESDGLASAAPAKQTSSSAQRAAIKLKANLSDSGHRLNSMQTLDSAFCSPQAEPRMSTTPCWALAPFSCRWVGLPHQRSVLRRHGCCSGGSG